MATALATRTTQTRPARRAGSWIDERLTALFLVPGLAKFVVVKKPATKERKGINPFTKEPTVFKARPARKIIRARPVKAAKDGI